MGKPQVMEVDAPPGDQSLVDLKKGTRRCIKCGDPQDFSQFRPNAQHPTGTVKTCTTCIERKRQDTRAANTGVAASASGKAAPVSEAGNAPRVATAAGNGPPPSASPRQDRQPARPDLRIVGSQDAEAARRIHLTRAGITQPTGMNRSLRNLLMMRALEAYEEGRGAQLVYPFPITTYHAHYTLQGDLALSIDLPEFLEERGYAPPGYEWRVCLLCGHVSLQWMKHHGRQELAAEHMPDTRPFTIPARIVDEAVALFAGFASGSADGDAEARASAEDAGVRAVLDGAASDYQGEESSVAPVATTEVLPVATAVDLPGADDGDPGDEVQVGAGVGLREGAVGDEGRVDPPVPQLPSVADVPPIADAGALAPALPWLEEAEAEPSRELPLPAAVTDWSFLRGWQETVAGLRLERDDLRNQGIILEAANESLREIIAGLAEQNTVLQMETCRLRDEMAQARLEQRSTDIQLLIAEHEREIAILRLEQWKVEGRLEDLKTPPVSRPQSGATGWLTSSPRADTGFDGS